MGFRRYFVLVPAAAALAVAAPALAAPKAGRLVAFNSCPSLLSYAKAHATPYVTSAGLGRPITGIAKATPGIATPNAAAAGATAAPSTPQQGIDYSGTNNQEVGVDEPDTVKTDGNTLYTIANSTLESVDISGKSPKLLDSLQLSTSNAQLLLSGTHLLVLSRGGYYLTPLPAQTSWLIAPLPSTSTLTEIDVSDPSSLTIVKTLTLDGQYVDARMVGSTVRIVSSSSVPYAVPLTGGSVTANKATLAKSRIGQWLPSYKLGKAAPHAMVQCRDVWRTPAYSGLGLLTVLTIDLSKGLAPVDSTAIMTDGRIVYASPTSLFVATEKWSIRPLPATPQEPPVATSQVTTQIHDFDISDPTKTTYLGSGTVPGYLLDQWSLSDFQGVLRVVSTDSPSWWGNDTTTQSYLTTLKPSGGQLVQVGQLGGLGQGEKVYSVRFVDNTAFVDTFRQIDPLYTIDVSNPAQPKELGELQIEGYSSYLHPIGDGLLLGVGQDVPTTGQNEPSGSQLSLFDVSNLAHPTQLAHVSLGEGWSDAESDHHAFLYWPATGTVVVPLNGKAETYTVSRAGGFKLVGAVAHPTGTIDRSLVDRGSLVTVSDGGVQANDLGTLAMFGWAPFPVSTPVGVPVPGPIPAPLPVGKNAT